MEPGRTGIVDDLLDHECSLLVVSISVAFGIRESSWKSLSHQPNLSIRSATSGLID
jgi:hypothetical protein